ncbi:alkaline phosphatase family protein [bacterium]|nr:alkaline phosphatase family protein [candidate division CSSED10-310 bacterium]
MVESTHARVFILGLDGATFDLLDPWIDSGYLPNLEKLKRMSAWGVLQSTNPPTTPPAWTTCITGLNPGRHGVYDFTVSPLQDPNRPLVSSSTAKGLKIWHIFNKFNKRCIVVNVPITYPPEPIDGIMISGMMTPSFESDFTYPNEIKHRIKAVCGNYIPNIDIPKYDVELESDAMAFLDDIKESFERRYEAVRHLMKSEKWDFFMVVFILMDRIQHLFYKYLLPGSHLFNLPHAERIRQRVIEEYQRCDTAIGEIRDSLQHQDMLFVISDHGFGSTDAYFNTNTWLLQNGFLAVNKWEYLKKSFQHHALTWGNSKLIKSVVPLHQLAKIRKAFRSKRSSFLSPKSDLVSVINWRETKAYFASIPSQGIYINESNNTISLSETNSLKEQISKKLSEIKNPINGNKLIDQIWYREEIFKGNATKFAPHILFRMNNYSILGRQHLGSSQCFTITQNEPNGFHRSEGVLIVAGKNIESGQINQATITDILPSVLYASGLPIPEGLDGKILTALFKAKYLQSRTPQYFDLDISIENSITQQSTIPYSDDEKKIVQDRLKSLGYLE